MRILLFVALSLLTGYIVLSSDKQKETNSNSSIAVPSTVNGYQWTEQTVEAAFAKSYNFQLFSIHDTLWAFHPAGNWYSLNGKDWEKSMLPNSINNLAFLDYIVFNNSVLGLGHFEGNIEHFTLTTEIYQTTDMKNWKVLSKKSNLPKRFFYHPFVFNNKIWIIGGSDSNDSFADIWNSDDGVNWVKRADNMPFGKRDNSQFVIFNNKIYLINNDVWSSPDGLNWTLETKELVKGETIYGSAAIVFDGKIWMLGCDRNAVFKSEILTSTDGKKWTAQRAPWTPRGGIAAAVFNGQIFMTGGKYGGPGIQGQTEFVYSNDVWALKKV
jgi:hypothetical protein